MNNNAQITHDCDKIKRIYCQAHALEHAVDWDADTRLLVNNAVDNLQNFDRRRNWVAGTHYDRHFYHDLLDKLSR